MIDRMWAVQFGLQDEIIPKPQKRYKFKNNLWLFLRPIYNTQYLYFDVLLIPCVIGSTSKKALSQSSRLQLFGEKNK